MKIPKKENNNKWKSKQNLKILTTKEPVFILFLTPLHNYKTNKQKMYQTKISVKDFTFFL